MNEQKNAYLKAVSNLKLETLQLKGLNCHIQDIKREIKLHRERIQHLQLELQDGKLERQDRIQKIQDYEYNAHLLSDYEDYVVADIIVNSESEDLLKDKIISDETEQEVEE